MMFACVYIGLGAMSPPVIFAHIDLIEQYAIRYGENCWDEH